jgi:predicted dehydrogenase
VIGFFTSRARQRESTGAWGLELIGSKGSARITAGIPPGIFLLKTNGWKASGRTDEWQPFAMDAEPPTPGVSAFAIANARLVDDWLGAIREKREPICSGRNGAKAVEMVMAVYQAALSQARVPAPLAQRNHPLL